METKKYYIKKELILEIEVVQNEFSEPEVPIDPMGCRVEWHPNTMRGYEDYYSLIDQLNKCIKIDPRHLQVVEDEMMRSHSVKKVTLVEDGPRRGRLGSCALHGMSKALVVETEEKEITYRMDDLEEDEMSDSVTPMKKTETILKTHLHLPHELHRYYGDNWEDKVDFDVEYTVLGDLPSTSTDLTEFMEVDEEEERRWGILRVIDGGKDK